MRLHTCIIIAAASVYLSGYTTTGELVRAQGSLAARLFSQERYRESLEEYSALQGIADNPAKYVAIFGKANCYYLLGNFTNAEADYYKVIDNPYASPGYKIRATFNLVLVSHAIKDVLTCERRADSFIRTYPTSMFAPYASFYKADAFFNSRIYRDAKVRFVDFLKLYPECEKTNEATWKLSVIEILEKEEELKILEQEIRKIQKEIEEKRKEIAEREKALALKQKELEDLKKQLDDFKAELDARKKELDNFKKELDAYKKELDDKKAALDTREKEIAARQTALEAREKELKAYEQKLTTQVAELKKLEDLLSQKQKTLTDKESTLDKAEKTMTDREKRFEDAVKKYQSENAGGTVAAPATTTPAATTPKTTATTTVPATTTAKPATNTKPATTTPAAKKKDDDWDF
ncbi:MAG: hypothetical protein HZC28_06145 [Spirochaetes bacterium]|nr:hypothetical protein [Spirochaetota bacterium]